MPQAITAAELRQVLEAIPKLTYPATLTDGILDTLIADETSVVLVLRGLTSLPGAGLELDIVKGAVRDLSAMKVRRHLRPDDSAMVEAIHKDRELILETLRVVKDQGIQQRFMEVLD